MSRRTFLRGFGLLGVVVAGASSAMANNQPIIVSAPTPEPPKTNSEFAKMLEEQGNSHLQFSATYGVIEPPKPPPTYSGYEFYTQQGNLSITPLNSTKAHLTIEQTGNVLMGTNWKKFVPGTEKTVDIKMKPGPDGELYVHVNGQWKRLLTTA